MCELLGFSSDKRHDVSQYIKILSNHSDNNPHGWGMAIMQYGEISVIKEPMRADKSKLLKNLLSGEIITDLLIGHIRRATIGDLEYSNCHPFLRTDRTKLQWGLFHNGTIFNTELIRDYVSMQDGTTDSECILLYIIDAVNTAIGKNGALTAEQRFNIVSECVTKLSKGNKLNLMIYAGGILLIHTNMINTLYCCQKENSVIFATVPFDNTGWEPVPMMTLLGYKRGRLIFEGKPHTFEYIYNPDDLKGLYLTYSGL